MCKILSIIIPSYNTEQYIDECLPTMLSKEILDDIEILLINDGSKDNTVLIAQKYVDQYPNTVRLINKENGGHGSVINRGIQEAVGRYFKVIDGDDWVETAGLVELVHQLKNTDADMILNPYFWYMMKDGTKKLVDIMNVHKFNKKYNFEAISRDMPDVQLHSVTYKTLLLKEHSIQFQEHCFYEDQEYDVYPMLYVNSILFLETPVYVYRIGAATQSISVENVIRNKKMADTINDNLMDFFIKLPNDISDSRREYLARVISRMLNHNCSIFFKMPYGKDSKNGLVSYFNNIKEKALDLYEYNVPKSISLIRKNNWIFYSLAYVVFLCKRKKRGF